MNDESNVCADDGTNSVNQSNDDNDHVAARICPHCHKEFLNIKPKVFSNHVRWCKDNPDRDRLSGASFHKKITAALEKSIIKRFGAIKEFTVSCAKCGKQFVVKERESKFPSKKKYFCSSKCNHSHEYTIERRLAASERAKQWLIEHKKPVRQDVVRVCLWCGKEFVVKEYKKKRFCTIKCARRWTAQRQIGRQVVKCKTEADFIKLDIKRYREACKFKFSLNWFPLEFDFDLIKKYGWYKAKKSW